ncbi:isoprenoid synthase domain-containing protein [Aspergillus parasiticus]|uniref:Isoprenoid synthase domain-containing protein n=1 Tax=Aspergillus parasiticus TaxID=5067 RepID=A0A5N6DUG7_ASPPA|nr:isoprenoid synthase domain-containing protein [Aspergillus parasiticus]
METHINTHSQLIKRLRAQPVSVPNLLPIFSSWPGAVNPHWRALVPVINARIDSLFPEPVKATKLKRCDFAHLASTRWPLAGFNELYILAFLSLWLVTWDDQIDDTKGSLSNDFEAAEQYRRETLYFVAQCLDLDITEGLPRSYNDSIFVPDDPIVQSFDVIGEALCDAYTYEQRHRFLREMSLFMVTSHMEQKAKLEGHIPSLEGYWRVRMGTSAVGVICAVNEYSLRSVLPCAIMEDHDMRTMWNEVNVIASM